MRRFPHFDLMILLSSVSVSVIMPPCVLWLQYRLQFYRFKAIIVQTVASLEFNSALSVTLFSL